MSKIQFEILHTPEIPDLPNRQPRGQSTNSRNSSLDGLRGIAVILTFLVHYCGTYMSSFRGANPNFVAFEGWHGGFDQTMYWLFRSHHGVLHFLHVERLSDREAVAQQGLFLFPVLAKQAGSNSIPPSFSRSAHVSRSRLPSGDRCRTGVSSSSTCYSSMDFRRPTSMGSCSTMLHGRCFMR